MYSAAVRYAKAYNNKFAFKVNFSYSAAQDWHATSDHDRNASLNPFASLGRDNPGTDIIHKMGDEDPRITMGPVSERSGPAQRRNTSSSPLTRHFDEKRTAGRGMRNLKSRMAVKHACSIHVVIVVRWVLCVEIDIELLEHWYPAVRRKVGSRLMVACC